MRISQIVFAPFLALGLSQAAQALPFRLLLESDADRAAGSEVFIASFDTFDDLINSPPGAPGLFSGINISPDYSIGGLAYDGMYRLLLESNADSGAGSEVFIASFATFDDLINSPPGAPGLFSGINISPGYSIGGLVYDGMYRLLLESNADSGAGSEVFIASFATFDDLINSPPGAPGLFSGINISPGYSIGGLSYDGMYRLLLESNADSGAGSEVFIASFATFDDLVNSPPGAPGLFSGINISPDFSVRGLAYEFQRVSVPEPATLSLLLMGLVVPAMRRRRVTAARPAERAA